MKRYFLQTAFVMAIVIGCDVTVDPNVMICPKFEGAVDATLDPKKWTSYFEFDGAENFKGFTAATLDSEGWNIHINSHSEDELEASVGKNIRSFISLNLFFEADKESTYRQNMFEASTSSKIILVEMDIRKGLEKLVLDLKDVKFTSLDPDVTGKKREVIIKGLLVLTPKRSKVAENYPNTGIACPEIGYLGTTLVRLKSSTSVPNNLIVKSGDETVASDCSTTARGEIKRENGKVHLQLVSYQAPKELTFDIFSVASCDEVETQTAVKTDAVVTISYTPQVKGPKGCEQTIQNGSGQINLD